MVIITSFSTKLGSDEPGACLLNQLEKRVVLDASHLDDLGDTVADPSFMECLPEISIGDCKDWWMICTIKVLETVAITAGSWRRSGIDSSDDRSAEHNIGSVPMIEGSGKASDVSDDTTTNNENWFISRNTIVLHVDENFLNIFDVFVDFVTFVDQLDQRNAVGIEVSLKFLTKEVVYLIVNDSDASSEGLVIFCQNIVLWIKNVPGNLDSGSQNGAHDSLNGLRIWCGQSQAITVSVDAGWVD
jgi:hypothetical protein